MSLNLFKFEMDSIYFKTLQTLTDPKRIFPSYKKFETKYGCEGFEEKNNFIHKNFFIFEMYFK
jgi:hypothetical protein